MLVIFIVLLFAHWLADFVYQSDWMAKNKSKRIDALLLHVWVYMSIIALFALPILGLVNGIIFILVNGAAHFCIDFVTSRISSKFFADQDYHNGFVIVGLDQWIHQAIMGVSILYLA